MHDGLQREINRATTSGGVPLPELTRGTMENAFAFDFSEVRVHTGTQANAAADDLRAHAFTAGADIAFRSGQYNPGTPAGDRLLAHELAHVVQQANGLPDATIDGGPADALELEADAAAERAVSNAAASGDLNEHPAAPGIQRTCRTALGPPVPDCPLETTDFPGEVFRFVVGCDDLEATEHAHLTRFAAGLPPGTRVRIHGYASTDGDPAFNLVLSCHRARRIASMISVLPTAPLVVEVLKHGPVPGAAGVRRAAWIEVLTPVPAAVPPAPVAPAVIPACAVPANPDMSGRSFNPTTDSQATVIAQHPIDAFSANSSADDAFAAARASGLPGPHLGPQDALRHCAWNCLMAQRLGAVRAEQFATAHENSGPSAIPFDNQQDLHDNAVGRSLGLPGADCEAECSRSVSIGTLRTVRGPHTRPSAVPPVPTDCIGPSDQPWP